MREHAVDGKGLTAVAGDAIAAGVIVYRPDAGMLERLLAALQPQVDEIYLFCNSPPTAEVRAEVEALQATIIWLGDGSNAGLGVGYNQIMQTAVVRGLSWVVLFDQDSTPSPGTCG